MEAEMELESFVSETLKQVINGIKTAQADLKDRGAAMVPAHMAFNHGSQVYDNKTGAPINYVSFYVAVTTSDAANPNSGEGVFISEGKFAGDPRAINTLTTRIKFSVPIMFPKDPSNKY